MAAGTKSIREQILAEAIRLFSVRGFAGTALQEVADAVGIRKPSLLYHFSSKDALRRGAIEDTIAHFSEVLPGLLRTATTGEGQFDAVLEDLLGFLAEEPYRARILLRELLDRPDETKALLSHQVSTWIHAVSEYIRKGQAQGRVRPEVDPDAFIIQVISLALNTVALAALTSDLVHMDRQLAELARMTKTSLFI